MSGGSGNTEPYFSNREELGRGTCHVLARARRYGRWYVLKALREEWRGNAVYEEWLYKEYSVGVSLDHPNIVRVESFEEVEGLGRCIVMEWVTGVTLGRWKAESGARKAEVLRQLMDAVGYCHSHGIYHHDIKPSNVLVTPDGRVKLIDFGLSDGPQYAAFKQPGGTDDFAAPEQCAGAGADHRADIYALGRMVQVLYPHRYRRAVRRALNADPGRRQPSVEALRQSMRPRWCLGAVVLLLLAMATFFAVRPSEAVFATRLPSGQVVAFREVQRLPHPEVAIVSPDTLSVSPQGALVLPETIRRWGLRWRVVAIEDDAFRNAVNLKTVTLPSTLRSIGNRVFSGCISLADTLVIPSNLEYLGPEAFNDCTSLTTVLWQARCCDGVPAKDYYKYPYFFRCLRLREAIVDTGVEKLPIQVFSDIRNLERITVREGMVDMTKDFAACSHNLRRVTLPSTLRSLGHGVFYETALDTVLLPEALEEVGDYAFAYCDSLRVVYMGSKVRSIDSYCFTECKNLREIVVRSVVPPDVQPTTFNQLPPSVVVRVPANALDAYRRHPVWGGFDVRADER